MSEFLPISSSAHLIIFSTLTSGRTLPISLNLALHMGTLVAVLIYFWRDWANLCSSFFGSIAKKQPLSKENSLLIAILIGCIPAGFVGVLWAHKIEEIFHHPATTLIPLAVVGVLIWVVDRVRPQTRSLDQLTFKDAGLIGLAQTLALIPGVSRSGITMLQARLLDFKREDAARFSFLLGSPLMAGAVLIHGREILTSLTQPVFYIGLISSTFVGCLAIGFLMRFLKRFGFGAFAIYRLALAAAIFFLAK